MMDDLISREALYAALTSLRGVGGCYVWDPEKVLAAVEKAPSAVVRCVECKYSYGNKYCTNEQWKDDGGTVTIEADDFCSYGERRVEDA